LAIAQDCDMLVVLTEWNEFRTLDLSAVAKAMRGRILVDLRNVFVPADAASAGLLYVGVGRPRQGHNSDRDHFAPSQPSTALAIN